MKVIPKRKLLHVGKVFVLLTVVSCVMALVKLAQHFRNTEQTKVVSTDELNSNVSKFEMDILRDQARIITGLGENGTHLRLFEMQQRKPDVYFTENGVNVYISDRISYNRTIRDLRNPDCLGELYDAELPSTSIVIVFYNEIFSVLLRLVWGIINSARRDNPLYQYANFIDKKTGKTTQLGYKGQSNDSLLLYIKEIILVDDYSTLDELKEKLDYYVKTRLPPGLIKIVRLPEHYGLIRAKMEGARHATAEVLVFLDSHCEVHIDWLRPLLQNLKHNTTYVLLPLLDVIDGHDFSYTSLDRRFFQVGGFKLVGYFHFRNVLEEELKRRGSDIGLTMSPTMSGGLFAMHRSYFWELGAYDEKMKNWGGENLEMSFRIWMCGGTLAAVPCSRVGHLHHGTQPHTMKNMTDFRYNVARMVKVWMDEYAESFYLFTPYLKSDPAVGDVSDRVKLREKLKCKSFRWYLENIYKDKYIPGADSVAFGRFMNYGTGFCLHDLNVEKKEMYPLIVFNCRLRWRTEQFLSLTKTGQLRVENPMCVYIKPVRRDFSSLQPCRTHMVALFGICQSNIIEQDWRYLPKTRQLQNVATKLCLESPDTIFMQVLARKCDEKNLNQVWFIEYSDASFEYEHTISPLSEEESKQFLKLAGQRMMQLDIMTYSNQRIKTPARGKDFNITDKSSIEFIKKVYKIYVNSKNKIKF